MGSDEWSSDSRRGIFGGSVLQLYCTSYAVGSAFGANYASYCAGDEMLYMDHPTALVIAGCLCVIAASSVVIVTLRICQTFCAVKINVRRPTVSVASRRSAAGRSSSTRLTNSGTEQCPDGDDTDDAKSAMLPSKLERNARQNPDAAVEN